MTMAPEERGPWETESGLIDDVDAYIANPHFGIKEEYSQAVLATTDGEQKGIMLLLDLVDENGEILGNQGYSIGTGWEVSEDGLTITHAKRKNVVTNTLYGQLQNRVTKELGIDMSQYGLPTEAMAWNGLGFHWNQQTHMTVGGVEKPGLMPTAFIGILGETQEEAEPVPEKPAPARPALAKQPVKPAPRAGARAGVAKPMSVGEQKALELVAQVGTAKEFMLKAIKVPEIAMEDALMAQCVDDSATGFFKTHKGK